MSDKKIVLGRFNDLSPQLRMTSVYVRTLHLVFASVVLGAYMLGCVDDNLLVYLILAALSGIILLWMEFKGHPDLFKQLSGLATIVKILLFMTVPLFGKLALIPILLGFVIAVLAAHLPKRWRHRMIIK